MKKRVLLPTLILILAASAAQAIEQKETAKTILIGRILDEIESLKLRKHTLALINASYAQIDCIKGLKDVPYGIRECKKRYKRVLYMERAIIVKKLKKEL